MQLLAAAGPPSARKASLTRGRMVAIVIVAIVIVAAVAVLYSYASAKICPGTTCERTLSNPALVIVQGSLKPASASLTSIWNLNITVRNTASAPISGISVTNSSSLPPATGMVFKYDGQNVSAANTIPIGEAVTGYLAIQNVTSGTGYTMTITISLQGHGEQQQTLYVVSQS